MSDKETQTSYKLTEDIKSTARRAEIEGLISTRSRSSTSVLNVNTNLSRYLQERDRAEYENYPGTETVNYDFTSERHNPHKTNQLESIAHLIKGTLGAGALTMHEAYMNGGLWTSLGFTFIFGFLNFYTMYMLSSSAQLMYDKLRVSKLTYPELAEAAAAYGAWEQFRRCSKMFRYIVDFSLGFFMSGTCCIYQIIIAATFKEAMETAYSDAVNWFHGELRTYILITSPLILLLCMIRKLKVLALFSILSDIFVAICVLATLYYSLKTGESISDRPAWTNFNGFMKFCGLCIYCTCGIAVCLPVENNMREPRNFRYILLWGMTTVVLSLSITGFFGYLGWGESCKSPITVHMPTNTFTTVLQFLLSMMLSVTYVVQFWVPFRILWHYIKLTQKFKDRVHKSLKCWERLYRGLFVFLMTCVSLAFPNLLPFMVFLSYFFLGFIAFVFPAFIESLITWKDDRDKRIRWRSMKNVFLIAFGFLLSISAFYLFYPQM